MKIPPSPLKYFIPNLNIGKLVFCISIICAPTDRIPDIIEDFRDSDRLYSSQEII